MKAYVFGPTKKSGLIKFVEANIHTTLDESSDPAVTVTAQPGLTANGQPTSNAANSIDYLEIKSTDNYGFINDFIEKF